MRNRRFVLLAAVLVVLNTALWLAPQGLALRQVVAASLFGRNMVRAEVIENSGADWRVDRGLVVTATSTLLTIAETDGRVQDIVVSSSTKVTDSSGNVYKVSNLKTGWRVLVVWPASGAAANSVKIESKHIS